MKELGEFSTVDLQLSTLSSLLEQHVSSHAIAFAAATANKQIPEGSDLGQHSVKLVGSR